jgi:hypothetical protein
MKCVIAGSRKITNYDLIREAFTLCDWSDKITEIVSGKAKGVDTLGEEVAKEFGLKVKPFPADWDTHKRAAGPIRNEQMAKYTDIAIVVMIKGGSNGSRHMIHCMERKKKPVMVFEIIGEKLCRVK